MHNYHGNPVGRTVTKFTKSPKIQIVGGMKKSCVEIPWWQAEVRTAEVQDVRTSGEGETRDCQNIQGQVWSVVFYFFALPIGARAKRLKPRKKKNCSSETDVSGTSLLPSGEERNFRTVRVLAICK